MRLESTGRELSGLEQRRVGSLARVLDVAPRGSVLPMIGVGIVEGCRGFAQILKPAMLAVVHAVIVTRGQLEFLAFRVCQC